MLAWAFVTCLDRRLGRLSFASPFSFSRAFPAWWGQMILVARAAREHQGLAMIQASDLVVGDRELVEMVENGVED